MSLTHKVSFIQYIKKFCILSNMLKKPIKTKYKTVKNVVILNNYDVRLENPVDKPYTIRVVVCLYLTDFDSSTKKCGNTDTYYNFTAPGYSEDIVINITNLDTLYTIWEDKNNLLDIINTELSSKIEDLSQNKAFEALYGKS